MGDTIVYWRSEGRHDMFASGQQEAPGETDCKLRTGSAGPAVAGLLACHGKQTADQRQMQAVFKAGKIRRKAVFVTKTLWNTNHRPERVKPALDASLRRLKLDCRDERCQVIYDRGVAVIEAWQELERLVDDGRCKSIGLSDVALEK